MMKPKERCLSHHRYGVALVPLSLDLHDDSMLFIAASQINRGGPLLVKDAEQAVLIANLNLNAGTKAMKMSDFTSAYSFFRSGISFLPGNHWSDHYSLSLSLFESAAKCATVIGKVDCFNILSQQIIDNTNSFEDKLETFYLTIDTLANANQPLEAIEKGNIVLSELGEELPEVSCPGTVTMVYVEQTKMLLRGLADSDLIGYRSMKEKSTLMAMKLYARLEAVYHVVKPGKFLCALWAEESLKIIIATHIMTLIIRHPALCDYENGSAVHC